MSDTIAVDGVEYVSSKRAALISGYAQDYIGQLCRSGQIASQRIGGLWYITLDSLYKHKQKADSYVPVAPRREQSRDAESLISFAGKDYVSAARGAEITGYHRDYVSQLARSGTVPSRQVGSRWFVEREALVAHKKHKDALLGAVQAESVGLVRGVSDKVVYPQSLANIRYSGHGPFLTYTSDNSDLLPATKSGREEENKETFNPILRPPDTANKRNIGQPRSEPRVSSVVFRPTDIRVVSHPREENTSNRSLYHRRSLHRAQWAALGSGVATVVIFLALGAASLRDSATYASRWSISIPDMSAVAAGASESVEALGEYLERLIVPEITYERRL